MPRRLALAAAPLVLLVASLGACAESVRIPPAEPSSATQPLFATDEEALEAATAAYEEYLRVVDTALQNPEPFDSPFTEVASGRALDEADQSLQTFLDRQIRITGNRTTTGSVFQQSTFLGDTVEVQFYLCESVKSVGVVDAQGNSLVEEERPELTAFEVTVVATAEAVLVHERVVWAGGGICEE